MCIVRSHIRFCLYIFVFTLPTTLFNQFTQPNISFLLSPIIFINQICLFANTSFQPVLSTPSFFLTICLNTSTANTAKPFFFATISSASNHLNQFFFFLFNHFTGFPCLHHSPPCNFLARLSISFVLTEKSWGETCRGIELSIPRICVAHV